MRPSHILCHYSEIGLKGKNRRFFEDKLRNNIKKSLQRAAPDSFSSVRRLHGRILVKLTPESDASCPMMETALQNTFGLAYFAFVRKSKQDLDVLCRDALEAFDELEFDSFRITARRGGQEVPFSARKVNEVVGAHILERLKKKVNLGNPDATCFIDMFQAMAFVYTERIVARGGLPVSSSGKVVGMLSGGIDSPVAAYYAMKRGARVTFVHFHSMPYTTRASIDKVHELIQILNGFQYRAKLRLIELAPIQKEIMTETPARYRVIFYRRFMFRITEAVARRERAHAVVTGESLGQVASQTLENMDVIESVTAIPILRPLIGMDKQEIIDVARDIGTYETSILPDQDCCSLFVPERPATKARLADVAKAEEALDVEGLVNEALDTAELVNIP
ncbi:MAG: tRNA uracil 4-sulfurtransferase ThiI [Candidatus Marinimicrobia bacterium]|jgi:thiamine biosynthesis protein ThiI|nr:tRNA uracil 4-sulfurtransferase ThiI [Candidatus Neomarinimicrobiota bacterium]MDP6965892.1 tRNA uracil 4-sulfurtransferase ThiI [Candidatus Neomarinimicrobiota bacterium]